MFRVVLFSCIPLVVDKHVMGMALGVQTAVYNIAMAIIPLLIGKITVETEYYYYGYFWDSIFFIVLSIVGLVLTIFL
jgi:hypothetical protein